jgi:hypothetical protein
MKKNNIFVYLLLVGLLAAAFASNCAVAQTSTQPLSGDERIVELYVQGCD